MQNGCRSSFVLTRGGRAPATGPGPYSGHPAPQSKAAALCPLSKRVHASARIHKRGARGRGQLAAASTPPQRGPDCSVPGAPSPRSHAAALPAPIPALAGSCDPAPRWLARGARAAEEGRALVGVVPPHRALNADPCAAPEAAPHPAPARRSA
eukprot:gene12509-biopygen12446